MNSKITEEKPYETNSMTIHKKVADIIPDCQKFSRREDSELNFPFQSRGAETSATHKFHSAGVHSSFSQRN